MASRTQETIYDSFKTLAAGGAFTSALERTAAQINALGAVASKSQGSGNSVVSAVTKVFTTGLGLVPLLGGLFGLFGGGHEEPPPLVKYSMPERIYFQGADTGNGIRFADYDQMGMPRVVETATATASGPPAGVGQSSLSQITVNVNAMDSRSFLDHSTEIAQAVRQAMLNLNPINDVVSDL